MKDTQDKAILVLGGTGKTGRRVVERLAQRGFPVRNGSRSGRPPFDWEEQNTWPSVLQNVESVYVTYYSDLAFPGASDAVSSFCSLAVANGVRRLVLLSGRGEDGARLAEQAVEASGAEWTIVRSSWFCQNFSENFLLESVLSGEVAFPAGNVAEPFIDAEDIADVAAAALTEPGHTGQIYEVTGPRLLTFAEAVAEIAKATGREVRYLQVSAGAYETALLDQGVPANFVTPLIGLITTVLDGRNARLADGVRRALGRAPRDFSDYVRTAVASGVWSDSTQSGESR
ncbi:MAG: hypothetical protein JWO80_3293 [Bryobacterales bacterium]|nr:hypothetical protein [Bryobacterales bacterium]